MSLSRLDDERGRLVLGGVGVAVFMLALGSLDVLTRGAVSLPALVPPFGASVVIVFFAPDGPAARPWNVVCGQALSAGIGCAVLALFPHAPTSVQAALAVTSAGLGMIATRSFHPPGGATALLAVLSPPHHGFAMVLCPMLVGAILLVAIRRAIDEAAVRWPKRGIVSAASLDELAAPADLEPDL